MSGADADAAFGTSRAALIGSLKSRVGEIDRPILVSLEEFFEGNTDYGSIGCNLTPMLGPDFFYKVLTLIRSRSEVLDVLVEVTDINEHDTMAWPFSDRVHLIATASREQVLEWSAELQPDSVEDCCLPGASACRSGTHIWVLWWD